MRILLENDTGVRTVFEVEALPKDTEVVLLRTNVLLMKRDMDAMSKILTEKIGKATVILPAWVKDIKVLQEVQR